MIAIIDYGMGNLLSVSKALDHLGIENRVSDDPRDLESAGKLILPGVGAFGNAMRELENKGLVESIRAQAREGKPLLGICLGMQLIMDSSDESPGIDGLGLVAGTCKRFKSDELKIPHMGWNTISKQADVPVLRNVPDEEYFYFVHSYYVFPDDQACTGALTDYVLPFTSVLRSGNIMATQFHPEKSQSSGLIILREFAGLNG
jgi:glutamine amidotransferase